MSNEILTALTDDELAEKGNLSYSSIADRTVKISDHLSSINLSDNGTMYEVKLGDSIQELEPYSFSGNTRLEEFDASSSKIRELGEGLLDGCTSLKRISLPRTYESEDIIPRHGSFATRGTYSSLENITVDPSNALYVSNEGCLFRRTDGFLLRATKGIMKWTVGGKCTIPSDFGHDGDGLNGIVSYAFYGLDKSDITELNLRGCGGLSSSTSTTPSIQSHAFHGGGIDDLVLPPDIALEHLPVDVFDGITHSIFFPGFLKSEVVASPNYNSWGIDESVVIKYGSGSSAEKFNWSFAYTIPGYLPAIVGMTVEDSYGDSPEDGIYYTKAIPSSGYIAYPENFNAGNYELTVSGGILVSARKIDSGIFISWLNSMGFLIYEGLDVMDTEFLALYEYCTGNTGIPDGDITLTIDASKLYDDFYIVAEWKNGVENRLFDKTEGGALETITLYIRIAEGVVAYVSTEPEALWFGYNRRNVHLITVALDYVGTSSNNLPGMTNDCGRIKAIMNIPDENVMTFTNSSATKENIVAAIKEKCSDAGCNLLIFHFSGHGGPSGSYQYMATWKNAKFFDHEFWSAIKAGCKERCLNCYADPIRQLRVFCIFACCYAETMFMGNAESGFVVKATNPYALGASGDFGSGLLAAMSKDIGRNLRADTADRVTIPVEGGDVIDFGLLSWAACASNKVSYMTFNVGHDMVTAIVYHTQNKNLKTYDQVFSKVKTKSGTWDKITHNSDNEWVTPVKHWIGAEDFSNLPRYR